MSADTSLPVYVVDDDSDLSGSLARLIEREGFSARSFVDAKELLETYKPGDASCIVSDIMLGELNGFDLTREIRERDPAVSLIFVTAWPRTSDAVDTVKRRGGTDYIEKPINQKRLVAAVREAVARNAIRRSKIARTIDLTRREREVFELLVKGHATKGVARELGISPRTVEDHRAQIFAKTGTSTLSELFELALDD